MDIFCKYKLILSMKRNILSKKLTADEETHFWARKALLETILSSEWKTHLRLMSEYETLCSERCIYSTGNRCRSSRRLQYSCGTGLRVFQL